MAMKVDAKGLYSRLILLLLQLHEVFPQDREHQTLHPVGDQSCLKATTHQAHHTVFLYHMLHHVYIAGRQYSQLCIRLTFTSNTRQAIYTRLLL